MGGGQFKTGVRLLQTEQFYSELQGALTKVPHNDILIILGDFNARVGKSESEESMWPGVRGKFSVGSCNEASESQLDFCSLNNLSIINTWFKKKLIRHLTWKHPAMKQLHLIDFETRTTLALP